MTYKILNTTETPHPSHPSKFNYRFLICEIGNRKFMIRQKVEKNNDFVSSVSYRYFGIDINSKNKFESCKSDFFKKYFQCPSGEKVIAE